MRIVILTHRLGENYGGIVQAFALQKALHNYIKDGEVTIETTHLHPEFSLLTRIKASLKFSYKNRTLYVSSGKLDTFLFSQTRNFVARNVVTSEPGCLKNASLIIVGSDQVWRAIYVDPLKYMLGDIRDDVTTRRISYAASFGTDDLSEYSPGQIEKTAELAKKFDSVSVREKSGIEICERYWNIKAEDHVDPVLLLGARDYDQVIRAEPTEKPKGELFVYVLDRSEENDLIIAKTEKELGVTRFELMPREYKSFLSLLRDKQAYVMPKVEQWLRSFRDADFVVTDSFHGTVFSIIFNKPFITIGNRHRGFARFSSLLKMFGLENRLVMSEGEITKGLINEKIDWLDVNKKVRAQQRRSRQYLLKYLDVDKRRVSNEQGH